MDYQASSSHGIETLSNVDGWTSEELQHSSINGSAGAQNTEYGQGKQDGCDHEDCGTRHSSKLSQRNRLYRVETCDPERTTRWMTLYLQMSTHLSNGRHHHLLLQVVKALRVILITPVQDVRKWWMSPAGGPGRRQRRGGFGHLQDRPPAPLHPHL